MSSINDIYYEFHSYDDHSAIDNLSFYEKNRIIIDNIIIFENKTEFESWLNLLLWFCWSYHEAGRFNDCINLYQKFKDIIENNRVALYQKHEYPEYIQKIMHWAAVSEKKLGKYVKSIKVYKRLIELDNKNQKYKIGYKDSLLWIFSKIENIIYSAFFFGVLIDIVLKYKHHSYSLLIPLIISLLSLLISTKLISFFWTKKIMK